MKKLFYTSPAACWNEALPLGNGRLGAMVHGDPVCECLDLNEDTLWSGSPYRNDPTHSMEVIERIRRMHEAGDYAEADAAVVDTMHDFCTQRYLPYGKLYAQLISPNARVTEYRRELDLETGVSRVTFLLDGEPVERTAFVSLTDDVVVLRIKSQRRLSMRFFQAVDLEHSSRSEADALVVTGRCPTFANKAPELIYGAGESIHFSSRLMLLCPERPVLCCGGSAEVDRVTEVVALFTICTSFNGFDKLPVSEGREYLQRSREILENAAKLGFDALLQRHTQKHRSQFDRVSLELEGEDLDHIPTDQRIRAAAEGRVDNKLTELLFDYGRYLTIAGSQPGSQPMNLQGIWNDRIMPPWHSNYTININTEMNYWPTERCDLPECHEPLLKMLQELRSRGNSFGLRGWNCWHNTDLWRFRMEANKETLWGYWPMGGFWLCRHIWEHYAHTRDRAFLEEYYPVLEEAALFLEDWMFESDGFLTTCPSTSPENEYLDDGRRVAVCKGSAMDLSIIRDLFDKLIRASEVLGRDSGRYALLLDRLQPVRLDGEGRILEWSQELPEAEPGHRHISHLYGFHPADVFTGPDWAAAVEKVLRRRLENGGGHTGWSNAWIANVYARLGDGEAVQRHIQNMYAKSIYPNMLDAHPPFQIDGNFGICAAICEALMQDHDGDLRLLPALPAQWAAGSVRGFVARDGRKVSFRWEQGKIVEWNAVNR